MDSYREYVKESFKNQLAIINGEEYVSLDVFLKATSELALSDAVIEALANRYGSFELTEDEILDCLTGETDNVTITLSDGVYRAIRKPKK